MKTVILAEKPSVAIEYAKALHVSGPKQDGYIENDDYIITWCYGHLVTMSYPEAYDEKYKGWSMETLPFIPTNYKYEVIDSASKQFKIVKKLFNRPDVDRIIFGGDSGREGEYIGRLVDQEAGHNPNATEYRLWIDSQTEEEILKGLKNIKPLSEYDSLSDSSYARAEEDYLVGINFSRALSIKYGQMLNAANGTYAKGKMKPIAVGRVMSCVLGMIVDRERQIRSTDIIPFYKLSAQPQGNDLIPALKWKIVEGSQYYGSPIAYNNIGLLDKDETDKLASLLNGQPMSSAKIAETSSKKAAPLLFNLAELQATCSKMFKISPAETLAVAQSLYEKKLTTYPRTDARVLTRAITKEIMSHVSNLRAFPAVKEYVEDVLHYGHDESPATDINLVEDFMSKVASGASVKYVDDSKVTDHYAIIPTGDTSAISGLSSLERSVYTVICKRFISIFMPAAEFNKITLSTKVGSEVFETSQTVCTKLGFLKLYKSEDESVENCENDAKVYNAIKAFSEGVPAVITVSEGKSQPPKRYTTGSIILAMENAGQLIEDPELREQIKGAGIGTSATRAAVIEKLERNDYIKVDKKTQQISPAKLGEFIYELLSLSIPTIMRPDWTAAWERGLDGIYRGTVSKEAYMDKINKYVYENTEAIKNTDYSSQLKAAVESLKSIYKDIQSTDTTSGMAGSGMKCPVCGKDVISTDKSKSYFCTGWKDGCSFSVFKTWGLNKITSTHMKKFLDSIKECVDENGTPMWVSDPVKVSGLKKKDGTAMSIDKIRLSYTKGDKFATIEPVFEKKR